MNNVMKKPNKFTAFIIGLVIRVHWDYLLLVLNYNPIMANNYEIEVF